MKPTGYILHETPVIITVITLNSSNRKTGPMAQTWILPRHVDPVTNVQLGHDSNVCLSCPLGPQSNGRPVCYVNIGQAPFSVWRAYQSGKYPALSLSDYPAVFAGRRIRLGAYGDPARIPLPIVRALASASDGWTGYTHAWRNPVYRGLREYVMASCETPADVARAHSEGWRTFRVSQAGESPLPSEIPCPSERGVQCHDCRLCAGTSKPARSISIPVHGTYAVNFDKN